MKRLCLLTTSILLALSLLATGCSNDDGDTPPVITPTSTSGAVQSATTNDSGQKTASLSTSGGTYAFTETSAQSASLVRAADTATVDETKSGTWTFTEKDKTSAKYSGTYKGDISQLAKAEVKLSLTVTQTANSEGQLVNAESVSFDLTATTSKFTATIPEVKEASEAKTDNPAGTVTFDAQNYTLGKTVPYTDSGEDADGQEHDYEVVKNTFLTETSASANLVSRSATRAATESWETTNRYQNDDVMFAKVQKYTNLSQYLVLYEITEMRDGSMTGVADLKDKYIFLNEDGEKLLTFSFRWSSTDLLSTKQLNDLKASDEYAGKSDSEILRAEWEKLTEEKIRSIPPERFKILTTEIFSTEAEKTVKLDVYYNRNDDQSVDYMDDTKIKKRLKNHFVEYNGKLISPYKITEYPNNPKKGTEYGLLNSQGTFCNYATSTNNKGEVTYEIQVKGNGTFTGEVASNVARTRIKDGKLILSEDNGVQIETDRSYPAYKIDGSMIVGERKESSGDGNGNETTSTTVTGGVTVKKQTESNGTWTKLAEHVPFAFLGTEYASETSEIDFIRSDIENAKKFEYTDPKDDGGHKKKIEVQSKISVGCPRYSGELAEYAFIDFINPKFDEENEIVTWTPDLEGFLNKWTEAFKTFSSAN
jgi:hypothetical protein